MIHLLVITLGLFCARGAASAIMMDQQTLPYKLNFGDHKVAFQDWKLKFAHVYGENWNEDERFGIFSESVARIEKHNWLHHTNKTSFYMGLNQFSAMTNDEYLRYNHLGKYARKNELTRTNSPFECVELNDEVDDNIPDAVDWTKEGYVTPVKNQGFCSSCWIFSSTGALEGAYFRSHQHLISFSEQQILDCCRLEGCSYNCSYGGMPEYAFAYTHNAHGLESEQDYPYEAQTSRNCRVRKSKVIGNLTTCYLITPSGSETALKSATAKHGPMSVGIFADLYSFQHYSGGIYKDPDCISDPGKLDHGVLVTGYGTTDQNEDYWIIKNSWGEGWGKNGYGWILRNHNNLCGIADHAQFPVFQ